MAGRKGQRSGGHNAKPTAQHIADGTYQACRHSKRVDKKPTTGKPRKPRGLSAAGKKLWDEVVSSSHGDVLGGIDTFWLTELCELVDMYLAAKTAWRDDMLDRDLRANTMALFDRIRKLSDAYGLDPIARARLQVTPPTDDSVESPQSQILNLLASRN